MPEYLTPGVYVEEIEIGAKPIEGVSTSTVGMVGVTEKGRAKGLPILVTSFADFQRKFGGYLGSSLDKDRYLPYAVEAFFRNGGQRIYIQRILLPGSTQASAKSRAGFTTRLVQDTPLVEYYKLTEQSLENLGDLGKEKGLQSLKDKKFTDVEKFLESLKSTTKDKLKDSDIPLILKHVEKGNEEALKNLKKVKLLSIRGIQKDTKLTFVKLNDDNSESDIKQEVEVVNYDIIKNEVTLKDALYYQFNKKNTLIKTDNLTDNAKVRPESFKVTAKNPGSWGNEINIEVIPVNKVWSQIVEIVGPEKNKSKIFKLKSAGGFYVGAIVQLDDQTHKQFRKIEKIVNDTIILDRQFENNQDVVDNDTPAKKRISTCEFRLVVNYGQETEIYDYLTTNPDTSNYYYNQITDKSNLIEVDNIYEDTKKYEGKNPFDQPAGDNGINIVLTGGNDGNPPASASDYIGTTGMPGSKTGIKSLEDIDEINIIAAPGITNENVQNELINQCESKKDRFAVLDMPPSVIDVEGALEHRDKYDSKYSAIYFPWVKSFDPLDQITIDIPASGYIAGIYARSDNTRGVHKAPANEVVLGAVDVKIPIGKGEQDILNPKGVNCIRSFSGRGIRVWGARTISSDSLWKYINVRRLFIYLEKSIEQGTQWVVFEPNDEKLWARVRQTITQFLTTVWREGALMGTTPEEAFFVKCDRTTMTQDDIDNRRLICVIGVAPVKPAEFVIFRIAQWTGGSSVTE